MSRSGYSDDNDADPRILLLRSAIREVLDMFEASTHGYSTLCERADERLRRALRDEFHLQPKV